LAAGTLAMLTLVVFDFLDWHTISIESLLQASDRAFRLLVILDNVTLKPVDRSPINASAIVVVASEVHLNRRASGMLLSSSRSVRCPYTSIQSIDSLTVMMSICKCF
jgi:hypothetical protein